MMVFDGVSFCMMKQGLAHFLLDDFDIPFFTLFYPRTGTKTGTRIFLEMGYPRASHERSEDLFRFRIGTFWGVPRVPGVPDLQ